MTSATERIRAMLDERGVEWTDGGMFHRTHWVIDGIHYVAFEQSGKLYLQSSMGPLTPAQAIAATLGSCNCSDNCTNGERTETCEADETDTWECVRDDLGGYGKTLTVHVMECTECGHTYEHVNGDYEFCPRCGRKRRDVEE